MKRRKDRVDARWTSWEVCFPIPGGFKRPVSERFAVLSNENPAFAVNKMQLLELLGFPDASGSLRIEKADNKKPTVLILKCKPTGWRLYFDVLTNSDDDKRIVYLLAIYKKRGKQNPRDTDRARRQLVDYRAGRVQIARFPFPTDEPL